MPNLMVRRSQKKEVIKGAILLSVMILLIGALFAMAASSADASFTDFLFRCHEGANGLTCKIF